GAHVAAGRARRHRRSLRRRQRHPRHPARSLDEPPRRTAPRERRMIQRLLSASIVCLVGACISAPDVVLLDRKTVLEELASGELGPLENDLREEAALPRGVDFTRAELRSAGADVADDTLSSIVDVY